MTVDPSLEFRRLHPVALLLGLVRFIGQGLPVLLPMLIVNGGAFFRTRFGPWVIAGLLAVTAALAIADYIARRFALGPEALVVRSGVLRRTTRTIPYGRIQSVSTSQSLVQRLLRVGTLRVDTASGGTAAEAELSVLAWRDVERLQADLLRARRTSTLAPGAVPDAAADAARAGPVPSVDAPATVLATVDDEELLVAGATSYQLLLVLGVAIGTLQRFGDGWVELVFDDRLRSATDLLPTDGIAGLLLLLLGGVVVVSVLVVLWLGAMIATWARYRGFRLSRVGASLVREYGLLHRVTAATPMARVQAVHVRESLLRRLVRRAEVRLVSAGAPVAGDAESKPDVPLLLPIVRQDAVADAVTMVFGDVALVGAASAPVAGWRRVSRRTWLRTGTLWTARVVLPAAGLALVVGTGAWRLLWLLPLVWALTPLPWRVRGLGWSGTHLVVRDGAVARDTWIVPVSKLQQVQLRQGPVQRALGLATVRLTTAGIGGEADVVDLPLAEARALVDDLVARLPALRRRRPPLSVPTLALPSPHVA